MNPLHDFRDGGTIAATTNTQIDMGTDPNRRRFGYAPGAYGMEIEPRLSGRQLALIPQGRPVLFETGTLKVENYDIFQPEYNPWKDAQVPAATFVRQVAERFTKAGNDYGFRELDALTPLDPQKKAPDGTRYDEAYLYFAVVHPTFAELGHSCPAGLEVCPSCRVAFLEEDDEIESRVAEVGLDPVVVEALRMRLLEANVALLDYYRQRWGDITGELDLVKQGQPGLKALKDGEHHVRKCLHELAPEERQADVAAQYGAQQGAAFMEGMEKIADTLRERPADTGAAQMADAVRALAEGQQAIAQTLALQGDALRRLMEQQQQPAQAEPRSKSK